MNAGIRIRRDHHDGAIDAQFPQSAHEFRRFLCAQMMVGDDGIELCTLCGEERSFERCTLQDTGTGKRLSQGVRREQTIILCIVQNQKCPWRLHRCVDRKNVMKVRVIFPVLSVILHPRVDRPLRQLNKTGVLQHNLETRRGSHGAMKTIPQRRRNESMSDEPVDWTSAALVTSVIGALLILAGILRLRTEGGGIATIVAVEPWLGPWQTALLGLGLCAASGVVIMRAVRKPFDRDR